MLLKDGATWRSVGVIDCKFAYCKADDYARAAQRRLNALLLNRPGWPPNWRVI